MKIYYLEWKSFCTEDMVAAFEELGHIVKRVPFSSEEVRHNDRIEAELVADFQAFGPDFVFSFNYFPIISLACKKAGLRYVSWIYDSPYVMLYSYTIAYPGNYIFVFDKAVYNEFHSAGINTVHYLPMAANVKRLKAMTDIGDSANSASCHSPTAISPWNNIPQKNIPRTNNPWKNSPWENQTDIAFIGSLYTEKHQFYQRLEGISPFTQGYLEGLMAAQKQIQGYNFVQELLPPDIIQDLHRVLPMEPDPTGVESREYLFAQYVINRQITAEERTEYLTLLGEHFPYDLYTPNKDLQLPGCINHGPVDYYDMAPYVFKHAKINLNMSLRSIHSGMPLRIFDIMGAGGFLLTNFQADFLDYFVPGEDFVYYDSKDSFLGQIEYYLSHEEERAAIAQNGFNKIAAAHTYTHRVEEILSYLT